MRDVDYERAKPLFSPDVMGFGTYEAVVVGLEPLATEQWAKIWPTITAFRYLTDQLHWDASADVAWIACPWTSVGKNADGSTFPRPGRVSVGLRRSGGRWLATHTHHSLYPSIAGGVPVATPLAAGAEPVATPLAAGAKPPATPQPRS